MFQQAAKLLHPGELDDATAKRILKAVGFADIDMAHQRIMGLCAEDSCLKPLEESLPLLLIALSEAAIPDDSLVNFERYVQCVDDRKLLFQFLADHPRAVEILVKLFVGSQFLTEILLRNPNYLQELTQHKRLAEFKSREQFTEEATAAIEKFQTVEEQLNALRRFQHWELLRLGGCDTFGLFDLKSITVQLSLLADALVQVCLTLLAGDLEISTEGFVVLAFGKLGGEELNYSSDIDLVFLAESHATRFWQLGQRLINALMKPTADGFLYRVDMRLRPWGRSGALVNTVDAHIDYLKKNGRPWELQALLKARVIAGEFAVGEEFLKQSRPLTFGLPKDVVLASVRDSKNKIEQELHKQGRKWGEVKSGAGSIRDIEFTLQCLQLLYGREKPEIRSIGTLNGLVRLAEFSIIHGNEYRQLSSGYIFLRKIEHALQLMHHKQTHSLPESQRELEYLATRLDFPNAELFLEHYERHCTEIRAIYNRYLTAPGEPVFQASEEVPKDVALHMVKMKPSYQKAFSEAEINQHAAMLGRISQDHLVEMEVEPTEDHLQKLTIVGFDLLGDLSMMCGLLSVYGFNIVRGNVFSNAQIQLPNEKMSQGFVNIFVIKPPLELLLPEVWLRFRDDLESLLQEIRAGRTHVAHGKMAKQVSQALRERQPAETALYPIDVEIDNDFSPDATLLKIQGKDTAGFLYELTNALTLSKVNIRQVVIETTGQQVNDSLLVTEQNGKKITDPTRQQELQAAVVLIKHFTHLLPRSPNPESALLHFRDFLEQLFQQPNWLEELASLNNSEVLSALARLLGVSDFLWEDFLRLQHQNLFPVLRDVELLAKRKPKQQLIDELNLELKGATEFKEQKKRLNAFKDREMFRVDMRHIMGHIPEFGIFANELTHVADVVVTGALHICKSQLRNKYGAPQIIETQKETTKIKECPLAICALGKCGGREIGFASDIELIFLYEANGKTSGPKVITNAEYYEKLVNKFRKTIVSRQEGIFQIDLRLRPYGKAGPLGVSLDAFEKYFTSDGAAWPYERQALVKLRFITGDVLFGEKVIALRDQLVYTGEPFDAASMRAMREKQVNQLVQAGTINAKLSPGGLVDCEYLVQGLQITYGNKHPLLRTRSTWKAIKRLKEIKILTEAEHAELHDAYIFLRRLIDALRMVRGHAKDLTVPHVESEEFLFLARRLGYGQAISKLQKEFELHTTNVQKFAKLLEE
ncbi:Glutamate-ammonia-ligase adenylyltransferase [hydrothermal vent metagenome]|uniref:Glutamate-ammonia-ligase adenylyltransferase n=1 Tax=hydrothermal vent metagenome TaxID=652676 RepID=A0A3B1DEV4_9ZZZZ